MKTAKMKTATRTAATAITTTTNQQHIKRTTAPTKNLHFLHATMAIGELKRQQKSTAAATTATTTTHSPISLSSTCTWTWMCPWWPTLSTLLAKMPKKLPTTQPPPAKLLPNITTTTKLPSTTAAATTTASLATPASLAAAATMATTSSRQFNLQSSHSHFQQRRQPHQQRHHHQHRHHSWLTTLAHHLLAFTILCLLSALPLSQAVINCPIGCTCDDVSLVVTCSEGTLDVVPITLNPSIQRLIITNSKKIRTFDSSIQFYYDLNYLDLSHNELVNIPADTFKMQGKLRELNLSHNKIGQINNKTFNGLAALTVLNLRGNLLAELERATFATVTKIAELNLGANRISNIDPHAFDGLINLRVLYLDDNTLTTLPTALSFQALPSLAELYLGTNSFESLPARAFAEVKGLTRLDLRSAGLVFNITADAFAGLEESLRALDLADNRLQQVPTLALSRLQRLEELTLGQNDFEVLLPGAFAGLKNLKRLEINGAPQLKRIANGAFTENTNLELLNISGNKLLSNIEEQSLRGLPNLRHVNLRENQLSTLAEGLFPWADLVTLDLSENPFNCDCHVLWLRNLLVANNETKQSELFEATATTTKHKIAAVTCSKPAQFQNQPLAQLSTQSLGCASVGGNSQALIGVVVVGVTILVSLICLLIYGCRRRIKAFLKGNWGNSALGRKEREYQKTFSDEEYMSRQRHRCLGLGVGGVGVHTQIPTAAAATAPYANDTLPTGNYHVAAAAGGYMGSRPIPVTEL